MSCRTDSASCLGEVSSADDLGERCPQIAVVVEIPNQQTTDRLIAFRQAGQGQLPEQVVFERCRFGDGLLIGREIVG